MSKRFLPIQKALGGSFLYVVFLTHTACGAGYQLSFQNQSEVELDLRQGGDVDPQGQEDRAPNDGRDEDSARQGEGTTQPVPQKPTSGLKKPGTRPSVAVGLAPRPGGSPAHAGPAANAHKENNDPDAATHEPASLSVVTPPRFMVGNTFGNSTEHLSGVGSYEESAVFEKGIHLANQRVGNDATMNLDPPSLGGRQAPQATSAAAGGFLERTLSKMFRGKGRTPQPPPSQATSTRAGDSLGGTMSRILQFRDEPLAGKARKAPRAAFPEAPRHSDKKGVSAGAETDNAAPAWSSGVAVPEEEEDGSSTPPDEQKPGKEEQDPAP